MDSVVHFELPAKDVRRASAFYNKAFGWQINKYPGFEYWSLGTTKTDSRRSPTTPGAINGGMGKKGTTAPMEVTVTIGVADIDATLATVMKSGGKIKTPKSAIGDMGFSAYFEDTEGNVLGLYQYPSNM